MDNKYCNECSDYTDHVRENSAGEVAAKVAIGIFTMGMSIGATPTTYICTKCGSEKEE